MIVFRVYTSLKVSNRSFIDSRTDRGYNFNKFILRLLNLCKFSNILQWEFLNVLLNFLHHITYIIYLLAVTLQLNNLSFKFLILWKHCSSNKTYYKNEIVKATWKSHILARTRYKKINCRISFMSLSNKKYPQTFLIRLWMNVTVLMRWIRFFLGTSPPYRYENESGAGAYSRLFRINIADWGRP